MRQNQRRGRTMGVAAGWMLGLGLLDESRGLEPQPESRGRSTGVLTRMRGRGQRARRRIPLRSPLLLLVLVVVVVERERRGGTGGRRSRRRCQGSMNLKITR